MQVVPCKNTLQKMLSLVKYLTPLAKGNVLLSLPPC